MALAAWSCGGDDKPNTTDGCEHFDYAKYTPGAAPVTLDAVIPIFTRSCALGVACHTNGAHAPNLGGGTVPPATVKASIVNVASIEVPSMKYVVPMAPQDSYLMRKLEVADPGCGLSCMDPPGSPGGCKKRMPDGTDIPLSAADQTTIRDWIKQGAN